MAMFYGSVLRQAAPDVSGLFNPTTLANVLLNCLNSVIMNYMSIHTLQRDGAIPSNERDRATVADVLRRFGITIRQGN